MFQEMVQQLEVKLEKAEELAHDSEMVRQQEEEKKS